MTIDQQTSIQRSVAMKAATDILCAEIAQGNSVPLSNLDLYYDFILAKLTEEE